MAAGDKPTHRIIRRNEAEKKWDIIGAGWEREDGKISLSIELTRGGEKVKGLLVRSDPKPAQEQRKPSEPTGDDIADKEIPF